ncbi:hypothetical protein SAMN06265379_1177 [Saccharicrinis carchari]|uniref:Uncharacterized protein n=1 Tax=Saccharicrinis carchari TaxID=1168039 RepID=A0A521F9J7_SACCC|nr:hypothetical protein [Saccharicrinis carchari]SMO92838.1 hypothetical protein SAMN06265379_1177 [Saccharicrinis carchari]
MSVDNPLLFKIRILVLIVSELFIFIIPIHFLYKYQFWIIIPLIFIQIWSLNINYGKGNNPLLLLLKVPLIIALLMFNKEYINNEKASFLVVGMTESTNGIIIGKNIIPGRISNVYRLEFEYQVNGIEYFNNQIVSDNVFSNIGIQNILVEYNVQDPRISEINKEYLKYLPRVKINIEEIRKRNKEPE